MTYILGDSLSEPMVDDDRPTVTMPAVSDPSILPWQIDFRIDRHIPEVGFVYASVQQVAKLKDRSWGAYVAVNGQVIYEGWHQTAEAARAAVEEHIAKQIEETA